MKRSHYRVVKNGTIHEDMSIGILQTRNSLFEAVAGIVGGIESGSELFRDGIAIGLFGTQQGQ